MSKAYPLVSIVIPSYNQGHFIADTLESVFAQTYANIEIIVIDGGSTDSTLQILKGYSNRIRYVSEPDDGQSNAINKGFKLTSGSIVTWLNSDDIYPDRDAVNSVVLEFESRSDIDFVYGDFVEIDRGNNVVKYFRRPPYSHERLLRVGYISQPATFFRRKVIMALSINEELDYAMDLDYWLRAHAEEFRFRHLSRLIAAERLHDDAKCVRDASAMMVEALAVRRAWGAHPGVRYRAARFLDRIVLYFYRLRGISALLEYARHPERLTVPLNFEGALRRTIGIRLG